MHQRGVLDPQQMTSLPQSLRQLLAEKYCLAPLTLASQRVSSDQSVKQVWLTPAREPVESVLLPGFDYGTAVCISCHSGCPLHCAFCATGQLGLRARLSAAEMLQQLYAAEALHGAPAERLVCMGMGEPLLNLSHVQRCIELLTSEHSRAWSPRRITVSTVGLVKQLVQCARELPPVNLALSLHFTTAEKRAQHMPGAAAEPAALATALQYYRRVNGGKITIEYMLLRDVNDSERDMRRLTEFAYLNPADAGSELLLDALEYPEPSRQQPLPLHVNLIEFNPVPHAAFAPSPEQRVNSFAASLAAAGVPVSVRHSRGRDVAAACGMLGAELA